MLALNPILRLGVMIAALLIGLSALSWAFPYDVNLSQAPLGLYIGLAALAAALWMWLPGKLKSAPATQNTLIWIFLIGLIARGAMFFSTPVLEDDSYRYLWDGAVTANAIDPYKYAPSDVTALPLFETDAAEPKPDEIATLEKLASEHPDVHSRINYPYVATIYPPITQAVFAAAHWIAPFNLNGWRAVLLGFDILAFGLLVKLLRAYNRKAEWSALYWWNPIVILQGFGAGHMDILVVPFLLATLLFAKQERFTWATLALAGAVGVKLWPALLFPFVLRPLLNQPVRFLGLGLLFTLACLALLAPQLVHAFNPDAGLNAYASEWRTHAFLFSILEDGVFRAAENAGSLARIAVAILVSGTVLYLAFRFADSTQRLPALFAISIATLLFLSPTGYPWYLIWIAPVLPFFPHPGLTTLTLFAPLYWLRFRLGDEALLHQWVIVPIAFGVPLALIAHSIFRKDQTYEIRHHYSRA